MTDIAGTVRLISRDDVHAVVAAMAPHAVAELTDHSRLVADLGYDSLRLIELSIALEQRFNVSTSDEATLTVSTVGEVVELVTAAGRAG